MIYFIYLIRNKYIIIHFCLDFIARPLFALITVYTLSYHCRIRAYLITISFSWTVCVLLLSDLMSGPEPAWIVLYSCTHLYLTFCCCAVPYGALFIKTVLCSSQAYSQYAQDICAVSHSSSIHFESRWVISPCLYSLSCSLIYRANGQSTMHSQCNIQPADYIFSCHKKAVFCLCLEMLMYVCLCTILTSYLNF